MESIITHLLDEINNHVLLYACNPEILTLTENQWIQLRMEAENQGFKDFNAVLCEFAGVQIKIIENDDETEFLMDLKRWQGHQDELFDRCYT